MTIIVCASCECVAPHEARGLCHCCYVKARQRGLLEGFAKGRRAPAGQDRQQYFRDRYQAQKQRKEVSNGR